MSNITVDKLKSILTDVLPALAGDSDMLEYFTSMFQDISETITESYLLENVGPFIESYGLSDDINASCQQLLQRFNDCGMNTGSNKYDDEPKLLEKSIVLNDISKTILSEKDQKAIDSMWGFQAIRNKKNEVFEAIDPGSAKYERKAMKEQKKFLEELETMKIDTPAGQEEVQVSAMMLPDFSCNTKEKDIHVNNVTITFGGSLLLDDADLRIVYGRRYGLVGRNGIGKTTLLKHMVS